MFVRNIKYSSIVLTLMLMAFTGHLRSDDTMIDEKSIIFVTHSVNKKSVKITDGKMRGIKGGGRRSVDVELINELINRMGYNNPIVEMPFTRGIKTVLTMPKYALFNVLRTPERENDLQWVGPLQHYKTYFHEHVKSPTNIKTVEDARQARGICVVRGNAQFNALVKLDFQNLIAVSKYSQCISILLTGKGYLMPASSNAAFFAKLNVQDKIKNTGIVVTEYYGYLALSKSTPLSIIKNLQKNLDQMKSDGKFQEIMNKYKAK